VHRHPLYYGVRNHIIDFLVSRSKNFADEMTGTNYDRRRVPVVRPGAPPSAASSVSSLSAFGERDGVRGLQSDRETSHPTPRPTGEGADRVRRRAEG
jgi:hypothetical protein